MFWEPLIIFIAQLLFVPILTLRTIMMVKGLKGKAAGMGVLEGVIYVVAIGIVLSDLSNYYNMAAYALGFGAGLYIGALIEEKLAIGYVTIEANIPKKNEALIEKLREVGFSVSTSSVDGISTTRYLLYCTARRDREKEFYRIIDEYEDKAFVASYEPRNFKGGYITKGMKQRRELFLKKKRGKKSA
ncbi:DUF2179 domain-containing protein [Evansella cellulosilytica]|uniref:UPF0316 protein Bcell_0693 n=1 Tax=Evansella cellulosilytica (strain ATCC 21833 / DSM 2522 / FERM P-1141 / JCM 9156 / N-4) TaxID=649639 RepID=E6TZB3_EVAC2|nr:DUF2179 domain-containing protein [Evansella cellulosilytica]ADU28975.1 hypothetical protein Bcell_0693 [Evansella cellulosilytica DSM 2522]